MWGSGAPEREQSGIVGALGFSLPGRSGGVERSFGCAVGGAVEGGCRSARSPEKLLSFLGPFGSDVVESLLDSLTDKGDGDS